MLPKTWIISRMFILRPLHIPSTALCMHVKLQYNQIKLMFHALQHSACVIQISYFISLWVFLHIRFGRPRLYVGFFSTIIIMHYAFRYYICNLNPIFAFVFYNVYFINNLLHTIFFVMILKFFVSKVVKKNMK